MAAHRHSVDAEGWAHFDYVKMPDYRWGIFLADPVADRRIGFGDAMGDPAWAVVPGEHRNTLRRLIVTQGDTEPASVEQQRLLGHTAPSMIDLRNLFEAVRHELPPQGDVLGVAGVQFGRLLLAGSIDGIIDFRFVFLVLLHELLAEHRHGQVLAVSRQHPA